MAAWLVCVSGDKNTFDFTVSRTEIQNLRVHSWGTHVCWQLGLLPPGLRVCGPPKCWCRPSVPAQVPAQPPARPAAEQVRTPAARACGLPREGQEPWGFPTAARSLSTVPGSPAVHAGARWRTENGHGRGSPGGKRTCGGEVGGEHKTALRHICIWKMWKPSSYARAASVFVIHCDR